MTYITNFLEDFFHQISPTFFLTILLFCDNHAHMKGETCSHANSGSRHFSYYYYTTTDTNKFASIFGSKNFWQNLSPSRSVKNNRFSPLCQKIVRDIFWIFDGFVEIFNGFLAIITVFNGFQYILKEKLPLSNPKHPNQNHSVPLKIEIPHLRPSWTDTHRLFCCQKRNFGDFNEIHNRKS